MKALFSRRILHRDLKPENILISPSGHLCLADFGLSLQQGGVRVSGVAGTLPYWAPEIWLAKNKNTTYNGNAAEVWAYGALMLELFECTGEVQYNPLHLEPVFDCILFFQPHFAPDDKVKVVDIPALVSDLDAADLILSVRCKLLRHFNTLIGPSASELETNQAPKPNIDRAACLLRIPVSRDARCFYNHMLTCRRSDQ